MSQKKVEPKVKLRAAAGEFSSSPFLEIFKVLQFGVPSAGVQGKKFDGQSADNDYFG